MKKTAKEFMEGCEHDGSFIPVNEVERLMSEFAQQAVEERGKEISKWIGENSHFLKPAFCSPRFSLDSNELHEFLQQIKAIPEAERR